MHAKKIEWILVSAWAGCYHPIGQWLFRFPGGVAAWLLQNLCGVGGDIIWTVTVQSLGGLPILDSIKKA